MLNNKIYWNVSYRESMRDEYKNDPLLELDENDIDLLDRELKCLTKHKHSIVSVNYELGFVVIEDSIKKNEDIFKTYKEKDRVPYVQLRPVQSLCDKDGNKLSNDNGYFEI